MMQWVFVANSVVREWGFILGNLTEITGQWNRKITQMYALALCHTCLNKRYSQKNSRISLQKMLLGRLPPFETVLSLETCLFPGTYATTNRLVILWRPVITWFLDQVIVRSHAANPTKCRQRTSRCFSGPLHIWTPSCWPWTLHTQALRVISCGMDREDQHTNQPWTNKRLSIYQPTMVIRRSSSTFPLLGKKVEHKNLG